MMETRKAPASVGGFGAGYACRLDGGGSGRAPVSLEEAFREERRRLEGLQDDPLFAAHLQILEDPLLQETIDACLQRESSPAAALREAEKELSALFYALDDEYLRARAEDLHDVFRGLLRSVEGRTDASTRPLLEEAVILAEELLPSDTVGLDFSKVRALVSYRGSATSHVAIIARSKGIPALFGIRTEDIREGCRLLADGQEGILAIGPTAEEEAAFRRASDREAHACAPLLTDSGARVRIYGNAGSLRDLDAVLAAGAEGIGLFRTEFLFLEATRFPTEEEQYDLFCEALSKCQGKPLTLRLLDIGGDKQLPYWRLPRERNPFLGLRGVRLLLAHPDLLSTQLRALLRAAARGPLRMMIPMVTEVEQVRQVRRLMQTCAEALAAEGIPHADSLPTGIMVETPAAVLSADELAAEADFFSIGTNDLTQYILVADRENPAVASACSPLAPAMRNAIRLCVNAARKAGIPVGVCGEMAADPAAQAFLAETGVDSLSLSSVRQIRARSAAVCSS